MERPRSKVEGGTFALFKIYSSDGKDRVGLSSADMGGRWTAVPSESEFGTAVVVAPKSYSCQSYVSVSLFASVSLAVKANGVCFGILNEVPPTA